jgi:hypothetical protein
MAELFNVVFAGEIAGKADPAAVRANVGKLFNASEAILDKLFSGQPVVIKKMVDRATAMDLRSRMKLAGANTRMVAVDEQGRPLPADATPAAAPAPAPVAPAQAAAPAAAAPLSMAERMKALAEQEARAAPVKPPVAAAAPAGALTLSPVGAVLGTPLPAPPPPPDIAGISMAAAGSDLLTAAERPVSQPVQVDISGISMAAVGSDVLRENEKRQVVPVQVDVSGITIAPPGADLEQIPDDRPPVNPDISHIKLA